MSPRTLRIFCTLSLLLALMATSLLPTQAGDHSPLGPGNPAALTAGSTYTTPPTTGNLPTYDTFRLVDGQSSNADVVNTASQANEQWLGINQTNFTVTQVYPANASLNVAPNTIVSASFSLDVDFSTVSTDTFTVRGRQTGVYAGTYTTGSVQFDAAQDFKPGEEILVQLSSGLQATDGTPLTPYAWQFYVAALGGSGVFTDSGQSLGNSNSKGVTLGDVDGDDDLDAFVGNYDGAANKVWLNDGAGNFTDSGQSLGSSDSADVAMGDLDGDGDLDAFVANMGWGQPNGHPNKVWLNDGGGVFADSGQTLGDSFSCAVALGDLDGDGDLDAFVGNYGQGNKVWLNDGTGNFSDSGQSMSSLESTGVALGDLDGDGDLDAFVANFGWDQPNKVWLNDGTGTFSDSGQSLGSSASPGAALGDVDGDGDLDAFVTNTVTTQAGDFFSGSALATHYI